MAQKVIVALVDDLDGGKADETVGFKLDGTEYEIDLSTGNAGKLRDALACFVAAARRGSASEQPARRRRQPAVRTATRAVVEPPREPVSVAEREPVRIAQNAVISRNSAPPPVAPVQSSDTARIREWAKRTGLPVADRGSIPPNIRAAYNEEHGDGGEGVVGAVSHAAAASTFQSAPPREYEDEKEHNRAIREWAWKNGYPCPVKGRIPEATRLAHDREMGRPVYKNPTRKPYKATTRGARAVRNNSPQVEVAAAINGRDLDPAIAKAVAKAVEGGAVFSDA